MSADVLRLPGVRPGRRTDAGALILFRDACRIGLLPYATEAAARTAIRRGLIPGVIRQRRALGGFELLLDPWHLDPWLAERGRVTVQEYRAATRLQRWEWERTGQLSYRRKVSRVRAVSNSNTAKN